MKRFLIFIFITVILTYAAALANPADPEIIVNCGAVEDEVFIYVPIREAWHQDATITFQDVPDWLSVLGDTIFGIPREGIEESSFKVVYKDPDATTLTRVLITVDPVNDPPQIISDYDDIATQGLPYNYIARAEDPDNEHLIYTFEDVPDWATAAGRVFAGTPPSDAEYVFFTVAVSDGEYTTRQEVTLKVHPGQDPGQEAQDEFNRLITGKFGFVVYPSPLDTEEHIVYFGFVWKGTSIRYSLSIFDMEGTTVHKVEEDVWNPEKIVRTHTLDAHKSHLEPGSYVAELRVLDKENGTTLKSRKVIHITS